jgi:hypothetical protein
LVKLACEHPVSQPRTILAISDIRSAVEDEQRKRQKRTCALSPEQRLERFAALQAAAELLLASNPVALEAFHRRNRRQRTEGRVRALEALLRRVDSKDGLG